MTRIASISRGDKVTVEATLANGDVRTVHGTVLDGFGVSGVATVGDDGVLVKFWKDGTGDLIDRGNDRYHVDAIDIQ